MTFEPPSNNTEPIDNEVLIEAHELLDRAKLLGQALRERIVGVVGEANLTSSEFVISGGSPGEKTPPKPESPDPGSWRVPGA